MKFFLSFNIILLFYQNHEVSCFKLFKYMSDKMTDFKNSISNAFNTFVVRFQSSKLESNEVPKITWDMKVKPFSDFVAKEAAKSELEFPEYFALRSEPTALMSTPHLAAHHGKTVQTHTIVTKDGYILTLHRLRSPIVIKPKQKGMLGLTILMHHGLLGSSADWILQGPDKSLPYKLSNAGYDVWLLNARGNYYSRGHTTLNVDSLQYWKFSWEQMGTYDLPAVVDYIQNITKSTRKLNFIGHSMGATAFLVMLSVQPHYNNFFRMGILLAPLVYMSNILGPMRHLTEKATNLPQDLRNFLGRGEFAPNRLIPLWMANKYCNASEVNIVYCSNPLLLLSGSIPEKNSWSKNFTARVLFHVPAGGSTDTILHYAAMVKTGEFHEFYDVHKQYPLSQVSVPIAIFSSNDDSLATKSDILRLKSNIRTPIDHHVIQGVKLNHMDFVWHPEADKFIFPKVIDTLNIDLYK